MITRISRASPDQVKSIAEFVFENESFMKWTLAEYKSKEEVGLALREAWRRWNTLVTDRPVALLDLHNAGTSATVDWFCPETIDTLGSIVEALLADLRKMKVRALNIAVPEPYVIQLSQNGFESEKTLVRLSGHVKENKLIPILPLTNPTERDIPSLAKLMFESFSRRRKTDIEEFSATEKILRDVIGGFYGRFIVESSYIGGMPGNPVSACFITSDSPHCASVTQLFTHPLYRARGLATTEIINGMNRLLRLGYLTLSVWISQDDDVAKRLFRKLDFREDGELVQMTTQVK